MASLSDSRAVEQIRCDAYNDDPTRVRRVATRLAGHNRLSHASSVLQALGHPVRTAIYSAIQIEPLCVCELSSLLDMSSPAVMHHLKILGRAGLIEVRKEGKFAVYSPASTEASAALEGALWGGREPIGAKQ